MPDKRSHRSAHPQDHALFAAPQVPVLREAARDLSWLLGRDYSLNSSLKLVGDRYSLRQRQRLAVMRCACSDAARHRRQEHQCSAQDLPGRELLIDGYNVLTTIEAALAHGVLILGRDGCLRDLASMHGTFRKVHETSPAAALLGDEIMAAGVTRCVWLLDSPVSNSGRLKTLLEHTAHDHHWAWGVELVPSPDKLLIQAPQIIASSDSAILDRCQRWFNLTWWIVSRLLPQSWIVDLSL